MQNRRHYMIDRCWLRDLNFLYRFPTSSEQNEHMILWNELSTDAVRSLLGEKEHSDSTTRFYRSQAVDRQCSPQLRDGIRFN